MAMGSDLMEQGRGPEKDFIPRFGAGCLVLLGLVVAAMAVTLFAGADHVTLFGGIFYGTTSAGLLVAGIFWYRYISSQERWRQALFQEKALLSLAAKHGGYLTLAQVTLEAPYTAAESETVMARLVRQGFAQPELLDDGTVRYRFGGL